MKDTRPWQGRQEGIRKKGDHVNYIRQTNDTTPLINPCSASQAVFFFSFSHIINSNKVPAGQILVKRGQLRCLQCIPLVTLVPFSCLLYVFRGQVNGT